MLFDKTWQKLLSGTAIASGIPNITHLFGPGLSTGANIYLASDPDYASHVKQQWSSHAAPSYIGTIQPATIQDVQHIVRNPILDSFFLMRKNDLIDCRFVQHHHTIYLFLRPVAAMGYLCRCMASKPACRLISVSLTRSSLMPRINHSLSADQQRSPS